MVMDDRLMHLLAPDILEEARKLSVGVSGTAFGIGFLLWLTGWWGHRFWIVLTSTVVAGVVGLSIGPVHGMKPLVSGLLLALAAGVLALALVRVIVFIAGGSAAYVCSQALMPAAWHDPLAYFLVGGLISLLLFRVWTMVLTSGLGALVMGNGLLCMLDRLGKINAVSWCEQHAPLANGCLLGTMLAGVIIQFILDRRRARIRRLQEEEYRNNMAEYDAERPYYRRGWFDRRRDYRRAG